MEAKDVAERFVRDYQGARSRDAFERYLAPDVIDHAAAADGPGGAEGIARQFERLWAGLPDMRVEVHERVAEGDRVATYKSFVGTHQGPLFGVAPTGRTVHLDVIDIVRVEGDRIVEHWNVVDAAGLMQQLTG